jgi:hypothetical protein
MRSGYLDSCNDADLVAGIDEPAAVFIKPKGSPGPEIRGQVELFYSRMNDLARQAGNSRKDYTSENQ